MADKRLSKDMHELSSAISEVLGKIFKNVWIEGHIIILGFLFAPSNMILLVLYTIFMFLDTIDVHTGKFSHQKFVFNRRSAAVPGFFILTLLIWFGYFSSADHGGIGTLDFPIPLSFRFICFILVECVLGSVVLICWIVKPIAKKFWAYLNRWQQ